MTRHGEWFLSLKGRQTYPFDMRPEDVDIEEIAHSLSNLCRFQGHCRAFYSVAQHSVLVSRNVPPEIALQGLLHDATEAYCGDMIRPIKRQMRDYVQPETRIQYAIWEHFDLPRWSLDPRVKVADNRALQTERRDLLAPHRWAWQEDQIADPGSVPFPERIEPWKPSVAKYAFLDEYVHLTRP